MILFLVQIGLKFGPSPGFQAHLPLTPVVLPEPGTALFIFNPGIAAGKAA